ncbi:hypothetical protein DFQ27_000633 [Actinomortierella ambigua]|uniref:HPt domain-containing protein n=1 Tax=Actinomortierella ambigua TaxID=1343610 RepID=A0A9P6QEL3_9FUNG|nr:hypothetical protein DFQ27_000633 [Actinomortierella ambigua]
MSDYGDSGSDGSPGIVDEDTFDWLLALDEDNDHEFSESLFTSYFKQAEEALEEMRDALENKNLQELSRLGKLLMDTSAFYGAIKVRNACERLYHYGRCNDGTSSITAEDALLRIPPLLETMREDYDQFGEAVFAFYWQND